MHPAVAPMIDRAAYLGGCDGVALTTGADLLGIPAVGTMPHALVLMMGGLEAAIKAFDEVIEPEVRRVALAEGVYQHIRQLYVVHVQHCDIFRRCAQDYSDAPRLVPGQTSNHLGVGPE